MSSSLSPSFSREKFPALQLRQFSQKEFDQLAELAALVCRSPLVILALAEEGEFFIKSQTADCPFSASDFFTFLKNEAQSPDWSIRIHDLVNQGQNPQKSAFAVNPDFHPFFNSPLVGESGELFGFLVVFGSGEKEIFSLNSIERISAQIIGLIEHLQDKQLLNLAKSELQQEHARLQNIIDATEVGTWEWQIRTGAMTYSPSWASMLGYTLTELGEINRNTRNFFVHPEDLAASEHILQEYFQGKAKIYQCELRLRHKAGHWVWVLDRGQVMTWDEAGIPEVMFGTHTDITSQVLAKEQLAIREKKFRALIENSDDAVAIFDQNGTPTFVSASVHRVLGYTDQEALHLNLFELTHPEDREKVLEHLQIAIENPGIPVPGHTGRILHKDGTWRWLEATITSMLHDPVINGIIDNFKDVTEEVIADQKLKQSERRFKKMVLEGADLITILNSQGHYLYLSPNYLQYLGENYEDYLGRDAFELIHPDDLPRIQEEFGPITTVRQLKSNPFRIFHHLEGWRWVRSIATNLLDDPDIEGIVVNTVDISETVEIQNQLLLANERFELVGKASMESIYEYNPDTREMFLSQSFQEEMGLEIKSEKENLDFFIANVHPEDREKAVGEFRSMLSDPQKIILERQYRFRRSNGEYAVVKDRSIRRRDSNGKTIRIVGAIRDITKDYVYEKLDEYEKELIEHSLGENAVELEVFNLFLKRMESLVPNMKASIVKIIDGRLSNFSAPSLDPDLIQAIQGLPIGDGQGSCGTAAFLKERVVVQDVFSDYRWEKYTQLAEKFGVKACWSFPILNAEGEVIATIANYFSEPKKRFGIEFDVLERAHRIVGIVMAKFSYLEKIRKDNERYQIVNKSTNEAIFDWDAKNDIIVWGDSFRRVFGHDYSQKSFKLSDWVALTHPADRSLKDQDWEEFMADPIRDGWQNQFRLMRGDGSYAYVEEHAYMVRDETGKPSRMVGVLRDRTENYKIEILKRTEDSISREFRKQLPLNDILDLVLVHLMGVGNWLSAEIWLANKETAKLNLSASSGLWVERKFYDDDKESLEKISDRLGFPEKIWKKKDLLFWNDIQDVEDFIRKRWAKETDLCTAVGLPFIFGDQILGVCLLFGREKLGDHSTRIAILRELMPSIGAELIRKQQEEELQYFFNYAPDILAIASPRGYFTKVNPAFCKLLGYTEEELTSVPFSEFLHPVDLNQTEVEFSETSTGERLASNFVNRYRTKAGEYKYISWSSSGVFGPSNEVFAYGRDVTAFKKMEELLQNATQLSRVGAWEIDLVRNVTHWSAVTKQIHEIDEGAVQQLDAAINFYREDYKDMVAQKVAHTIKTGEPFDFEAVIVSAKGNERWVRAIGNAERVFGGTHRIFGSIQDITENKLMEERLRGISDNVPGAIFQYILKPDGTDGLLYVSKGSELIWGLSPEECMEDSSKIWFQVAGGGDMQELQQTIMESARTLQKWNFEWRVLSKEGQIRWHHGMGIPFRKADGTVIWDSLVMDVTERKRLEYLLEQTARMAKIGSWEIDNRIQPLFLSWSKTTADIVESHLDGVPLEHAFQIYSAESQTKAREGFQDLLQKGVPFDQELLLVTGKGNSKWVRCMGQAQLFEGKVIRAFGSFQDIHDRKIAELDLKKLFDERNSILESIGDGFFAVDRDWMVTYWNHQAEVFLRVSKEMILGKNLWEVFNQETETLSFTNYRVAFETGETVHFEEFYEKLQTWFSISAYPSPAGLTVFFKDITAAKESVRLIGESNDRFEKAAEATNDAIWDFQVESGKIYMGKGMRTLFGYDPDQMEKSVDSLLGLIHPEDKERVIKKLLGDQENPAVPNWNDEYRFKKADDTYAFIINRAVFIRNEKGKAIRIIGAITDLSERKQYEESLQRLNTNLEKKAKELAISNSELEQFAYVASHDLQEPLRMVSSFLSQLERKYKDVLDAKALQYINFAVDGAVRMRRIILDLLEFSRVGKHEDNLEWIEMPKLMQEIRQLQGQLINESKGQVLFKGCQGFWGYRSPIIQLFQNLVGNGLKYRREGVPPQVEVFCEDQGDSILFSVSDNGIGIKKEYFEKIFILFQRLHARDEFQGTGMGLAIVKKIVDNLGGKIWLESQVGEGTTFYFTLPKKPM